MNKRSERFDPTNAISLLSDLRSARHHVERELALLGFLAWMHWPNDYETISKVQHVAAAHLYYLASEKEREKLLALTYPISMMEFAKCIVSYSKRPLIPLDELFDAAEINGDEIADIVSFFMLCPTGLNPSLLKAIYLIEEGGFVPKELLSSSPEYKSWKRSASTSKSAWSARAETGPFIWTAIHMDFNDIFRISPASTRTLSSLRKLAANKERLIKFFRVALFVQERLIDRLEKKSLEKRRFLKFPTALTPLDPKYGSFEPDQLEILKRYRAPKLI